MRKRHFLATLIAAVLMGSTVLSPQAKSAGSAATITSVLGTVQVRSHAGWRSSFRRQRLYTGQTLRTGSRSRAQIRYDDGSVVRLGSRSVMRVRSARNLNLLRGKSWIHKTKNSQRMRVRTPIALATVIGTELFVSHNEQNVSHVTTLDGHVEVQGPEGDVQMVNPGEWVEITPDKEMEKPTPFDWNQLKKDERFLLDMNFVPPPDLPEDDEEDWK